MTDKTLIDDDFLDPEDCEHKEVEIVERADVLGHPQMQGVYCLDCGVKLDENYLEY